LKENGASRIHIKSCREPDYARLLFESELSAALCSISFVSLTTDERGKNH
jgi:hypothetical protein